MHLGFQNEHIVTFQQFFFSHGGEVCETFQFLTNLGSGGETLVEFGQADFEVEISGKPILLQMADDRPCRVLAEWAEMIGDPFVFSCLFFELLFGFVFCFGASKLIHMPSIKGSKVGEGGTPLTLEHRPRRQSSQRAEREK